MGEAANPKELTVPAEPKSSISLLRTVPSTDITVLPQYVLLQKGWLASCLATERRNAHSSRQRNGLTLSVDDGHV